MSNLLSNIEIDEIAENISKSFCADTTSVDIEKLVTNHLKIKLVYEKMVGKDSDKLGFVSDGKYELMIHKNNVIMKKKYPINTVVINSDLLNEKGRLRFTIAHELAHILLERINSQAVSFEQNSKRNFSRKYNRTEIQANKMAASLLMPKFLIKKIMLKYTDGKRLPIYGENVLMNKEKIKLQNMADELEVSVTALIIRLKELNCFTKRDITEYLKENLKIGVR